MLERILVKDFQCHRNISINFDPRCTVLVGDSGCGKSAILRALKWAMTNRPTGDSFLGRWRQAPYCFTKIWIDNRAIARSRGPGINEYRLDGQRLLPSGAGAVPQPVADLANVGDVNFAGQHDGPFWFLLTPGEVSKRLNDIIDLSAIDASLAEAASRVRKAKAAVEVCTDRLAKARAERDETAWAVALDADLVHAESQFLKSEKLSLKRAQIDDLVSTLDGAVRTQKIASGAIVEAARAIRLADTARNTAGQAERLRTGLAEITRCSRLASMTVPDLGRLDRLRAAATTAAGRRQQLAAIVFGLENLEWEVGECQRNIREIQDELAALAGTNCPACGQAIPSSPCSARTGTSRPTRPERADEVRGGIDYEKRKR